MSNGPIIRVHSCSHTHWSVVAQVPASQATAVRLASKRVGMRWKTSLDTRARSYGPSACSQLDRCALLLLLSSLPSLPSPSSLALLALAVGHWLVLHMATFRCPRIPPYAPVYTHIHPYTPIYGHPYMDTHINDQRTALPLFCTSVALIRFIRLH